MNLLSLVQQAAVELGLTSPNAVIGNTSADTVQMLGLINGLGNELMRGFNWQALDTEYRFYTTAISVSATTTANSTAVTLGTAQNLDATYWVTGTGINSDTYCTTTTTGTSIILSQQATASGTVTLTFSKTKYAMPSNYDRIVDQSQWDKTRHWQMIGPLTAQQWQYLKSGFISTGPRVRFRILGNFFQIWPSVPNNEYLGFEYLTNQWVTDSTGVTGKTAFALDSDICIFPDRLMVVGLKMKYFQIKGFDIGRVGVKGSLADDYQTELDNAKSNDQGSATLSFAPRVNTILVGFQNIPDSGLGS